MRKELLNKRQQRQLKEIAEAIWPFTFRRNFWAFDYNLAAKFSKHFADLNFLNRVMIKFAIFFTNYFSPLFIKKFKTFERLSPGEKEDVLNKFDDLSIFVFKFPVFLLKLLLSQIFYEQRCVAWDLGYDGTTLGKKGKKPHRWLK